MKLYYYHYYSKSKKLFIPIAIFDGNIYYKNNLGYFYHKDHGYLHRNLWISLNGPIPPGHIVSHLCNKLDNSISNLVCMSKEDHTLSVHSGVSREDSTREKMSEKKRHYWHLKKLTADNEELEKARRWAEIKEKYGI